MYNFKIIIKLTLQLNRVNCVSLQIIKYRIPLKSQDNINTRGGWSLTSFAKIIILVKNMHRDSIHYLLQGRHTGHAIEVRISGTRYHNELFNPGYPVTNSHEEHLWSECFDLCGRPHDALQPCRVVGLPFRWPVSHQ